VGEVISQHGVKYHQYADDTQLRLSMHANNTADGLADLAACTADVRQWYGLQLNPDKSEPLVIGTSNQLHVPCLSVSGTNLPVTDDRVVLVVALVERWTRDRKVAGSTPGRGAINSAFHPSGVGKLSTGLYGWG